MKRTLFGVALRRSSPGRRRRSLASAASTSAKADTKLFNKASQVVLVRDGDRTVMTMANDFKGEPKEFAVVIPVPTFLQARADPRRREVARRSPRRLLGAAPRRVLRPEPVRRLDTRSAMPMAAAGRRGRGRTSTPPRQGARRHHRGAIHGRRIRHPDPLGAAERRARNVAATRTATGSPPARPTCIGSYLKQNMRFFVAKVNLDGAGAGSGSRICGRCRWPTSRRSSCCRSGSAWSTRTGRRTCSSTR